MQVAAANSRLGDAAVAGFDDKELTAEVIRSFDQTPDPRLKSILTQLVVSLHDFVRKTDLSFAEWETAINFLTRTGQAYTPIRQEFILLSDVLGVSMLVDAVNHRERHGATQTTVLGPFYVGEHKPTPNGSDISSGLHGEPMLVECSVAGIDGKPISGCKIDVWHADEDGFYDSQKPSYAIEGPSLRARFISDSDGRFSFKTILPHSYPVPTDGPVGELLRAAVRHAMRPAHIHFLVDAPGYEPLVTHVFIDGDKYLHSDAVFGVKPELIATIAHHHEPVMPDGKPANGPWHVMTYNFQMNPGSGAVPKPLMPAATE